MNIVFMGTPDFAVPALKQLQIQIILSAVFLHNLISREEEK